MRFGLSLCPEVGRYAQTKEQARVAEALGYDSAWLPEHHLMAGYVPSPMLGIAMLGAITERIELGTDIAVVPFYNPVRLAEEVATLADMTGGRFIFGAGLGYRPEEFAAFNVPFEQRGRIMQESLEVTRLLLEQEAVTFHGDYTTLDAVTVYPRPQAPVPFYVGGWSRPALRRAARLGDAWFPGPTADLAKLQACKAIYEEELAEAGRTAEELPLFREVWVAEDARAMAHGVEPLRGLYLDDYVSWQHGNVAVGDAADPFDDLRRDRFIVGTPEEVVEELERYRALGVTHLIARMHFHGSDHAAVLRAMELFADSVIPAMRTEVVR
jgi:probable F420-dependent oxidoreductase